MKKIKMFNFLKKRKTQRKVQKDAGRSMVEMLGVLAIIGVLSIGGIAGYTMAMNRYKANEVLNLAGRLSVAAQTGYASDPNNWAIGLEEVLSDWGRESADCAHTQPVSVGSTSAIVCADFYEVTAMIVSTNGRVYGTFMGPVGDAIQSITGRDNDVLVKGTD